MEWQIFVAFAGFALVLCFTYVVLLATEGIKRLHTRFVERRK